MPLMIPVQNFEWQNVESQNVESQNVESQKVKTQNIESQNVKNDKTSTVTKHQKWQNDCTIPLVITLFWVMLGNRYGSACILL